MKKSISLALSVIGQRAQLVPDPWQDHAWVLSIDGAEQSHVDPVNPTNLRYEYLQRIDGIIRSRYSPTKNLRFLHVGGGALTLVRALQVHFPTSVHGVVEIEPGLIPWVCEHLPVPDPARYTAVAADGASAVRQLRTDVLEGFDSDFETVVVDIFHGPDTAPQLQEPVFYDDVAAIMVPDGLLVVNVGDEADLVFTTRLVRTLSQRFSCVALASHPDVVAGNSSGNVILLCSDQPLDENFFDRIRAAGPFPAAVLDPNQTTEFVAGRSAK